MDNENQEKENNSLDKIEVFNHQALVMECLRKVNEAGSHELRSGWYNESVSNNGTVKKVYIEDTRKKYIQCIKTALMVMKCDFDKEAYDKVNLLLKNLKIKHDDLLKQQWNWYINLAPTPKQQNSGKIIEKAFSIEQIWYLVYTESEVDCYSAIAEELNCLTKRLNFYIEPDFENE